MTVPALEVSGLSKTFAGPPALDRVDLSVGAGEVHALVGENGSGKSTLIKILSGFHLPDPGGHAAIDGRPLTFGSAAAAHALGARFVHQDLALVGGCTVADNLAFGTAYPTRAGTISTRALIGRARKDLEAVGLGGLDPTRPVSGLPLSVRTGVAVARALRPDPDVPARLLVLDEPTATMPDSDVRTLHDVVRAVVAQGVGVLYVTHRLDEVLSIADTTTVLRDGVRVATLPTSQLDRRSLVGLLLGDAERVESEVADATSELAPSDDAPVLRVRGLRAATLAGLDLDVRPGEIVGVAGLTGSGRESIPAAVFGAIDREGEVSINGQALESGSPGHSLRSGVAYIPADRAGQAVLPALSARENLTIGDLRPFWRLGTLRRGAEHAEAKGWFDRLDIRPANAERPLAKFSGGNQQKVVLARGLRREPRVLLLDEPSQGVDVGAKAQLHRHLADAAQAGCGLLVASTDTEELVTLCHRVLVVCNGEITAELRGDALTVNRVNQEAMAA